jgi:hypothetical protein
MAALEGKLAIAGVSEEAAAVREVRVGASFLYLAPSSSGLADKHAFGLWRCLGDTSSYQARPVARPVKFLPMVKTWGSHRARCHRLEPSHFQ